MNDQQVLAIILITAFRIWKCVHHAMVVIWMLEEGRRIGYENIHQIKTNIASFRQ